MALHGSVQINGAIIGTYEIQRLEALAGAEAVHRYRYRVAFDSWREPVAGELQHRYADGAGRLLGLVMLAASARAAVIVPAPGRRTGGATG